MPLMGIGTPAAVVAAKVTGSWMLALPSLVLDLLRLTNGSIRVLIPVTR